MKKIINIIGFYVIWWSCMLGASNDLPYLGPMVMVVLLIAHRFLFVRNIKEIYLVLIVGSVGTVVDSLMFLSGSFIYSGPYTDGLHIAPLWITAMWAAFAATVNHSMMFFKDKWLVMIVAGAIFGPAAYFTGESLGAIRFYLSPMLSAIVIGIVWAISMPGIFYINTILGLDE
tara:strand:+ start:1384 stop:1902 length:519 start_codon:yes stop_codon:yes gene_type:complete